MYQTKIRKKNNNNITSNSILKIWSIIFLPYFQKNVKAIFTLGVDVYVLQGIEGWLAEQVERGSDAPVDTLEKSKSVPKIKRLEAINKVYE